MRLPAAVLLDCDGTLVDSERVTREAMARTLASMGHTLTDHDVAAMVGHPWPHTRAHLVARFGLTDADVEAYRRGMRAIALPLLDDDALVFPDVVRTLDELAARGVPLAVCTSSGREHLELIMGLGPLRGRFAASVAREDVEDHKPSPVPYLRALAGIAAAVGRALDPVDATVVEDSAVGVAAGLAAGCRTVAVDRGAGLHDLSAADVVVRQLTLEVLCHPS